MIDHVAIHVTDAAASKAFYLAALAPLGYIAGPEPVPGFVGLADSRVDGPGPVADIWLYAIPDRVTAGHLALRATDRATVDAFHSAALEAGAIDNGAPGERPYHPGYYSAYALTPDGLNLEVVCHA